MGKCIYCNKKAGFFSKFHKECEEKYRNGIIEIKNLATESVLSPKTNHSIKINEICTKSFVSSQKLNETLSSVYSISLENFLEDGVLSETEENQLSDFKKTYDIPQEFLEKNNSLTKTVQAGILRDLLEEKEIENRINIQGSLPFKLMKNEKLIYLFQNVELYEQRTKTEYVGKSQGVSLRIAKGVYYRTGNFRGKPIKTTNIVPVTSGILAFTDKHLYFSGSLKNFRIKFDKIITVDPYSDAVGIQKDGVSAKPQIFKNVDGWFCYNYIQNIN